LFSSRRRHTRFSRDWSSDVCSSDLIASIREAGRATQGVKLIRLDAGDEIAAITNLNDREEDEEIEAQDAVIVNESEAEVVETSEDAIVEEEDTETETEDEVNPEDENEEEKDTENES